MNSLTIAVNLSYVEYGALMGMLDRAFNDVSCKESIAATSIVSLWVHVTSETYFKYGCLATTVNFREFNFLMSLIIHTVKQLNKCELKVCLESILGKLSDEQVYHELMGE